MYLSMNKPKSINVLMPQYRAFVVALKDRIRRAQYDALRAVNRELVTLYWDIGRMNDSRATSDPGLGEGSG